MQEQSTALREAVLMPRPLTSKWKTWSQLSLPDNKEEGKWNWHATLLIYLHYNFLLKWGTN